MLSNLQEQKTNIIVLGVVAVAVVGVLFAYKKGIFSAGKSELPVEVVKSVVQGEVESFVDLPSAALFVYTGTVEEIGIDFVTVSVVKVNQDEGSPARVRGIINNETKIVTQKEVDSQWVVTPAALEMVKKGKLVWLYRKIGDKKVEGFLLEKIALIEE